MSNLRATGLAFQLFAFDHGDRFPQSVPVSEGGSMDYLQEGNAYKHFRALSNLVRSPQLLICPADKRPVAATIADLQSDNVGYFVSLNASVSNRNMILAGDRNITNGITPKRGVIDLDPAKPTGWSMGSHTNRGNILSGNILFVDGSVRYFKPDQLRDHLLTHRDITNRIALPIEF